MRHLLIVLFAFVACTKENVPATGVAGKWELTEHYSDIGNGTGSWFPVAPADRTIIIFNASGALDAGSYAPLASLKRYEVINPSTIKVYTSLGESRQLNYSLDSELTLSYTCRETCRDRFRRIN
ncbi:MAG: hypothetical protein WKF70_10085 [Chitinophagaceae bacterium]